MAGCGVDLWTKSAIFAWRELPPSWRDDGGAAAHPIISQYSHWQKNSREVYPLVDGYFGIETALNQGALFGMGQGKVWLFALLSFLAIGGIIYWLFIAKAARDGFLNFALGLIMGGILGNLYDRLGLWGGVGPDGQTIYAVRDWILVSYGGLKFPYLGRDWPNFNIADSLLVCGAALLIWHSFKQPAPANTDADGSRIGQTKN